MLRATPWTEVLPTYQTDRQIPTKPSKTKFTSLGYFFYIFFQGSARNEIADPFGWLLATLYIITISHRF